MNTLNVIKNDELSSTAKVLYIYLVKMAEGENNVTLLDYQLTRDLNVSQFSLNKFLQELEEQKLIQKTNNKYFNNYIL